MIARLVLRHLALRPVRSAVFVGAYAAGVSVMLALLSIGEVMVDQARDEEWVGGGDITVLPAGVDLETLRLGGAVFFGIEGARFVAREVLGGPRLAASVAATAPWIDDRAIYLRPGTANSAVAVRASGQIPSAARILGADPELLEGAWHDVEADRIWLRPTAYELYSELDAFHLPPERVRGDSTWAEWHYFNFLWPEEGRWLYLSYIVGGDVTGDRWGGQVLARYRSPDGRDRVFVDTLGPARVRFSEGSTDLTLGDARVALLAEPLRYAVSARIPSASGDRPGLSIEVEVEPERRRYFPPAELGGTDSLVSGYVAPALRATASGEICSHECTSVDEAIAYHDHNWGTWGGVAWDWGVAHAGDLDVLYGGVHGERADAARRRGAPFLVYIVDGDGVAAILRLKALEYSGELSIGSEERRAAVPQSLIWTATQGPDSATARITIEGASLTDLNLDSASELFFAQMHGTMSLVGVIGGRSVDVVGPGFFETYVRGEAR